ncbi:MAG: DUF6282 family protein [Anaerolineae bacterium]
MAIIDVRGAIDMHCHSGPAIFKRKGDAREISWRAREAGMRAIVFKAHHIDTSDRAYFINQEFARLFPDQGSEAFQAIGAIALNYYQGGINPFAVKVCLQNGGKMVYMPVLHSAYHASVFGAIGTYGIKSMSTGEKSTLPGLTILGKNEELTQETKEVVALVKEYGAVIGTSHISPQEHEVLIRYAQQQDVPVVVTHAFFLPGVGLDFYEKMAELGAYVELAAVMAFPMAHHQAEGITLKQSVELIEAVGPDRCILSTDAGQPFNPWPHDALQLYAQLLHELGVSEDNLQQMMVENPRKLLKL